MAYDYYDSEAPFNMAVATLMRLDAILQQMRSLDYQYPFDSVEKQKACLGLLKNFYIQASPLLSDTEQKKYSPILNLTIKQRSRLKSGSQKLCASYDTELDLKIAKYLIEIQTTLRKYFMPKGRDLSRAVANIG
jgi:hypothetical protein